MSSNQKNWRTLAAAVITAGGASVLYLVVVGSSDENLRFLLRATARAAFLLFLFAFIARPLVQVLPGSTSRSLLRNRRQFGIAFAGVHTVHLGVIGLRAQLNPDFALGAGNISGAFVYLLILLMLITSFDSPAQAIGRRNWKILHKTGIYVVGFSFAQTLLPNSAAEMRQPAYILFSVLIVGAVLLRIAASVRRRPSKNPTEQQR